MEVDINKPFGEVIHEISKQWGLENAESQKIICKTLTSKNIADFIALVNKL